MPAKQNDGRIKLAELMAAQTLHLAWGTGNPAWDAVPEAEPVDATALVAEIGRRLVTQISYVVPDDDGAIETPQGKFTLSVPATRWLYVRTVFGFTEAVGDHIREVGLFLGGTTDAGLPAGQRYFVPAEVTAPGRLMLLDRSQSFVHAGTVRPAFDYVFPF